jgi:hypothetical protein
MKYCVVYPRMERLLSLEDKLLVETVERDIPKYGHVNFGILRSPGSDHASAL